MALGKSLRILEWKKASLCAHCSYKIAQKTSEKYSVISNSQCPKKLRKKKKHLKNAKKQPKITTAEYPDSDRKRNPWVYEVPLQENAKGQ